jgi:malic enzyme
MALQVQRVLEELRAAESMIRKNEILEDVHDRNETLYHRILVDHMEEMAPIIYTPTVGQACKEFAQRFRRNRGMYFCEEDRGHMAAMVCWSLWICLMWIDCMFSSHQRIIDCTINRFTTGHKKMCM